MAVAAISTRLQRKMAQYEATTGRRLTPQEIEAFLKAEYGAELDRQTQQALAAEQIRSSKKRTELAEKQMALTEDELRKQAEAEKIGGLIDIGSLGVSAYGVLGKGGKAAALETGAGKTALPPVVSANDLPSVAGPAVAGAGTGAALTGMSFGEPALEGAQAAVGQTLGAPALEGAAETGISFGEPALEGTVAGTTAGGEAATVGTAPGLFSVAGPAAIAGFVGSRLFRGEPQIGSAAAGALVGGLTAAGTSFGSTIVGGALAGGPVGALVGAVVGFIAGGSVICEKLFLLGYLDGKTLMLDHQYRVQNIDDETYEGYLILGRPIVKIMDENRIVMAVTKYLGVKWAKSMADKVKGGKGNLVGNILEIVGTPICKLAYRWKYGILRSTRTQRQTSCTY